MTQLWAWEYKGKTEYGWKHWERTQVSLYVAQDSSVSPIRNISKVTNLREVKVVDEDAVVFDKKVIDHWKNLFSEKEWNQLLDSVKLEIDPTPPVTEPKNFGAIVEAQVMINQVYPAWIPPHPKPPVETNYSKPVRWLRNPVTGLWSSEPCDHLRISYTRKWGELHNPTIISEGVEG